MTVTETRDRSDAEELVTSPMRVRKRDGSLDPVDVNKIVRAVSRSLWRSRRESTRMTGGNPDDQRVVRRRQHRGARHAVDPDRHCSDGRGAQLLASGRSAAVDRHRQGGGNQDIHSFSQSVAAGHRHGLSATTRRGSSPRYASKLDDAIRHRT